MTNKELIALLVANANKTQHIRAYSGKWHTGANRISDRVLTKIGYILKLLQDNISEGKLLKPNQCLLIYNFQPLTIGGEVDFYSLDMVIKPFSELNETAQKVGEPYQVVINGKTREVMNNSMYLVEADYMTPEEIAADDLEPSLVYGCYSDYSPECSFVAIASELSINNINDIFAGKYDKSRAIQNSRVFNSWTQAKDWLEARDTSYRYIAELPCCIEEFEERKLNGLGQSIIKVFDIKNNTITETPNKSTLGKEDLIDEQVNRMETMMNQS